MRRFAQSSAPVAARTLADFAGHWRVSRRILHEDGASAHFDGHANWKWRADGGPKVLDYVETGELRLPGQRPFQAERRYIWGEGPVVFFEDGRFFHAVPPQGGNAHHHCAPDDYHVSYDFSRWPSFTTNWTVSGPKKAYQMETTYVRIGTASAPVL